MSHEDMLTVTDVQLARHYYSIRDSLVSTSQREPKPLKAKRKIARSERKVARTRERLKQHGEFAEYDLRVVARSTVPDPERTPAMEANELRLWNRCTACHQELGESVYRFYLARRIERFEIKACSSLCKDEIGSFIALRRLVALLVQERVMLDMKDAALKAVGFDGAFIALGRTVRMRGFKAELSWYTQEELRAHREMIKEPEQSSEGLLEVSTTSDV